MDSPQDGCAPQKVFLENMLLMFTKARLSDVKFTIIPQGMALFVCHMVRQF